MSYGPDLLKQMDRIARQHAERDLRKLEALERLQRAFSRAWEFLNRHPPERYRGPGKRPSRVDSFRARLMLHEINAATATLAAFPGAQCPACDVKFGNDETVHQDTCSISATYRVLLAFRALRKKPTAPQS